MTALRSSWSWNKRKVVLTDSIPYLMAWRQVHPERHTKDAVVFCSKKTGEALDTDSMHTIYELHKRRLTKLLRSEKIPEEDRGKMERLLSKPFNTYVQRHSSITEQHHLTDVTTKQLAGWKPNSQRIKTYRHLKGNEAIDQILKHKGIIEPDEEQKCILSHKKCPKCNMKNPFDALKCSECDFILSFAEYSRSKVEKDQTEKRVESLEDQVKTLMERVSDLSEINQNYRDDYSRSRGWARGEKAEGSKVHKLAVDTLLDHINAAIEEDEKLPEGDRRELEYLRAHPWETEEASS